jgi:hypothetical protein
MLFPPGYFFCNNVFFSCSHFPGLLLLLLQLIPGEYSGFGIAGIAEDGLNQTAGSTCVCTLGI